MIDVFLSVAPIFLLIIIGFLLKKTVVNKDSFWEISSDITYRLLMPSMLFYQISSNQISTSVFSQYALVILPAAFTVIIFSLLISFVFNFNAKTTTSVLQGCVRHNAFIVLAIVSKLFGQEGLVLASLIMAILIPFSNIMIVVIMTVLLHNTQSKKYFSNIGKELLQNPILLSIIIGIIFSLLGFKDVVILHDTTKLLGAVALPLMLLTIGANIRYKHIVTEQMPILIAILAKILIFPVIIFLIAKYSELTQMQTIVAIIFGAVPTAVSSSALAKKMGGNVEAINLIITLQTLISFVSIPIIIFLSKQV